MPRDFCGQSRVVGGMTLLTAPQIGPSARPQALQVSPRCSGTKVAMSICWRSRPRCPRNRRGPAAVPVMVVGGALPPPRGCVSFERWRDVRWSVLLSGLVRPTPLRDRKWMAATQRKSRGHPCRTGQVSPAAARGPEARPPRGVGHAPRRRLAGDRRRGATWTGPRRLTPPSAARASHDVAQRRYRRSQGPGERYPALFPARVKRRMAGVGFDLTTRAKSSHLTDLVSGTPRPSSEGPAKALRDLPLRRGFGPQC